MPYKIIKQDTSRGNFDNAMQEWCPAPRKSQGLIPDHRGYWIQERKYGEIAIKYKCNAILEAESAGFDGLHTGERAKCFGSLVKSTYKYVWSGNKRGKRNSNKLPVYEALVAFGGTATEGELVTRTGLSRGQVHNCLKNGSSAKHPYVKRSASQVPQVEGYAHEWTLTDRGAKWLGWQRGMANT
jgi:hypothetical protein